MLNRKATLLDEVRYRYLHSLTICFIMSLMLFSLKCLRLLIRFLRRRYRHLRQEDQPVKQPPGVKKIRGRSNGGKKSKTQIVRVEVSPDSKRSEAEVKHVSLPDLNHTGNETKTSLEKRVPLFDLNQISVSTIFHSPNVDK